MKMYVAKHLQKILIWAFFAPLVSLEVAVLGVIIVTFGYVASEDMRHMPHVNPNFR